MHTLLCISCTNGTVFLIISLKKLHCLIFFVNLYLIFQIIFAKDRNEMFVLSAEVFCEREVYCVPTVPAGRFDSCRRYSGFKKGQKA